MQEDFGKLIIFLYKRSIYTSPLMLTFQCVWQRYHAKIPRNHKDFGEFPMLIFMTQAKDGI